MIVCKDDEGICDKIENKAIWIFNMIVTNYFPTISSHAILYYCILLILTHKESAVYIITFLLYPFCIYSYHITND